MRFRRRDRRAEHAESLAATARMEMDLGVGDWQATVRQMNEILAQISDRADQHKTETDRLVEQMRRRICILEAIIHRREQEYDQLQERFCVLRDEVTR